MPQLGQAGAALIRDGMDMVIVVDMFFVLAVVVVVMRRLVSSSWGISCFAQL